MKRIAQLAVVVSILVPGHAYAQWIACTGGSVTCTTQNVAIGHTTPTQILDVAKDQDTSTVMTLRNGNATPAAAGVFRAQSDTAFGSFFAHSSARTLTRYGVSLGGAVEVTVATGTSLIVGTVPASPIVFGTSSLERMRITPSGNVGIGTTTPAFALDVVGTIRATTSIGAVYQDVAEWVPASHDLTPGTVVVINSERSNEVTPSSSSYDTSVAGVVSKQPGIILGEAAATKEMIATTGRVRVHVTAANGPIRVGDLLSTSDKPGVAMRSTPLDLAGTKIHRPGTLIGKALESLESGEGDILVLLSLQ